MGETKLTSNDEWSGLDDGKVNFSSMSLTATVASRPIESPVKGALFFLCSRFLPANAGRGLDPLFTVTASATPGGFLIWLTPS